jgi:hypothetical protein
MKSSLRILCSGLAASLAVAVLFAASLAAQDVQLPLKTIQVKHFTWAEGSGFSQEFSDAYYEGLRLQLPKVKVAGQIVDEGATVPEADAANSVIVEGKFLERKKGGMVSYVIPEISLYRASDHKLIVTITPKVPYKPSPFNKDTNVGKATGQRTAFEIKKALTSK